MRPEASAATCVTYASPTDPLHRKFTVVNLYALLTRDLIAIAKFFLFSLSRRGAVAVRPERPTTGVCGLPSRVPWWCPSRLNFIAFYI